MIWTDREDRLNDFLTRCNIQNKNIQFEQTISNTSIPFLDVSVTLEGGTLTTDLYCSVSQPINTSTYITQVVTLSTIKLVYFAA